MRHCAVTLEHGEHVVDEALVVERSPAQIDADEAVLHQGLLVLLQPSQGLGQHPAVDHAHAAGDFGGLYQAHGRHQLAVLVVHAQQDFEVVRPMRRAQRHDRLHFQIQALDRLLAGQLFDQVQLRFVIAEDARAAFKHHQRVALPLFGHAAGVVGGGDHVFGQAAGGDFDQADGAAHLEGTLPDLTSAAADLVQDFPAHGLGLRQRGVRHDDQKLVAADSAQVHPLAQGDLAPLAHGVQHGVAGGMAVEVVDEFEAI